MSKSIQLELPLVGIQSRSNGKGSVERGTIWYYVYYPRQDKMLKVSRCGRWMWVKHDLMYDRPHLFNTREGASLTCSKFSFAEVREFLV